MNNIFKNAYFGKPYKTRDGRKAIYNFHSSGGFHDIIIDGEGISYHFEDHTNGIINLPINQQPNVDYRSPIDIVSEWKEPIDEETLDKIASELYPDDNPVINLLMKEMQNAYKAGYRKAKGV